MKRVLWGWSGGDDTFFLLRYVIDAEVEDLGYATSEENFKHAVLLVKALHELRKVS